MVRQRKETTSADPSATLVEGISEEEQWRIVEQTGILKSIPKTAATPAKTSNIRKEDEDALCSPLCEDIFNSILLIIPFSSLYIMMDILAHRQYAHKYTSGHLIEQIVWGIPLLSVFVFYTMRYKADRRVRNLLFLLSVACGCRMIYVVNWSNWTVVMRQTPPLATIWVYTIVQLDLGPAVLALVFVAIYTWWKGLRIIFS